MRARRYSFSKNQENVNVKISMEFALDNLWFGAVFFRDPGIEESLERLTWVLRKVLASFRLQKGGH